MKPIGYINTGLIHGRMNGIDGELLRGKWTDYHYTLYMDSVGQHPSAQWIISNWVTIKETIRRNIQQ
jgi:hypothetical protein